MSIKRKAQLVLEYAGIIALTIVVLTAMHVYLNRGLQGRLKESLDGLNEEQWAGANQDRRMSKTTTSFSYEGGPHTGSFSLSVSDREDVMNFRSPKP